MATVTAPIMTDATGQSIDSKLNSLLGKMDNLAAAFQPNASGIVYSNTTSGLTGDDVQEAIDEMAADVSEIKQSLSYKTVSDLFSITGAFNSIFEITNQSAYRIGNILYFYLELHRIGNITVGEHNIAQVSVTPKIPCTAIPFSNDFSMLVQTSKNVKLSTNSAGRAWYTLTGYILEN